mmetsp:Transcript_32565/g.55469  ORF Transcript_32565/g.55469 Transcript_32565/m.55469 type:complete len:151 (-) Transcript_32565:191-643(-)|eukprot:CAMPEP_0183703748 /NCGR_PEP_ID=MMETSP0737-20130205/1374_1 /TAXON_ID=385413 /ORGANISM="Thalassiosira miniscula, Strain CCMP1093" /LENGTH=150 /DNA_ID=CAMNT_0025930545 /DNA_START=168 /DNA_END=620 /DNA_ORIENTATION=-
MKSASIAPLFGQRRIARISTSARVLKIIRRLIQGVDCMSPSTNLHKSDDPFLYYSDDDIRMTTLKLEVLETDLPLNINMADVQRKTVLSFELDPLLLLDDMIEEIFDDKNEATLVENNRDDSDKSAFGCIDFVLKGDASQADLLAQLVQM